MFKIDANSASGRDAFVKRGFASEIWALSRSRAGDRAFGLFTRECRTCGEIQTRLLLSAGVGAAVLHTHDRE